MLKCCRMCKFGVRASDCKIACLLIARHNHLTGEDVPVLKDPTHCCIAWERRAHKIRVYGTDGITASPKNLLAVVDEHKPTDTELQIKYGVKELELDRPKGEQDGQSTEKSNPS